MGQGTQSPLILLLLCLVGAYRSLRIVKWRVQLLSSHQLKELIKRKLTGQAASCFVPRFPSQVISDRTRACGFWPLQVSASGYHLPGPSQLVLEAAQAAGHLRNLTYMPEDVGQARLGTGPSSFLYRWLQFGL